MNAMNGVDERGEYKPVPLHEDAVEARKTASVELVPSPSMSRNPRSMSCH
jgi:hypothetical protein